MHEARSLFYAILELEKPLIARINGPATGLGATLAVYADIAVAVDSAFIADPHVKVGLVPGDVGALIWPRLIDFQRAKELLMLGDTVSAPDAARLGLITTSVPASELDTTVHGLAVRPGVRPVWKLRWSAEPSQLNLYAAKQ